MLRLAALLLVLANLGYAAWAEGWLTPYLQGLPLPDPTREPERLNQQVEPQRIVLLTEKGEAVRPMPTPSEDSSATTGTLEPNQPQPETVPASTAHSTPANPESELAKRCFRVAALNEQQTSVLRIALLATQPDGGWDLRSTTLPPRWIVYSGKLTTPAVMSAKKAELKLLGIDFREVQTPVFQPGLAMGTYSTEGAAQQVLREVTRAGVRGAKVVQERAEAIQTTAQWPAATEAQLAQTIALVQRLGPEGLEGKQVQPCP